MKLGTLRTLAKKWAIPACLQTDQGKKLSIFNEIKGFFRKRGRGERRRSKRLNARQRCTVL